MNPSQNTTTKELGLAIIHQIVLNRLYDSLSKLWTMDKKHLSGLSIPDLHMNYVCHVAVNLLGLSVPDRNMDYVCHVAVNLSGLSVPDWNMDYVCHVAMRLSGLSVPDWNMDCACHVTTDESGLSIQDVHMKYGYRVHGIQLLEMKGVPTCQKQCCKRDIQLAYMSSLVLLLGGDVELNPGPRQNVVNDTTETTQDCDSDKQSSSENGVDSRLVMLSACQRKRLQNETFAERISRLARLIENQRRRLENETQEQRSTRLGRLRDNQTRRLEKRLWMSDL